jgi:hypothetical protein
VAAEKSHHHHHNHHHHHHHHHNKKKSSNIRDHMANTDLFSLYSMLSAVKTDLLWSRNSEQEGDETTEVQLREQNYDSTINIVAETETKIDTQAPQQTQQSSTESNASKGHVRRPSTVSVSSSNSSTSSTISDSESEVSSNENDSGIESESLKEKQARSLEVAKTFRQHLYGLHNSLEQMSEIATYLTARYQNDMGGC